MRNLVKIEDESFLDNLCRHVNILIKHDQLEKSEKMINQAISHYPHAPHPHSLYGILLEKEVNQHEAMCCDRAGNALEPTYKPIRYNLYR